MRALFLSLLFFSFAGHAQVCTGALGDPIVKFTFGAGLDLYGPPLPLGVTNLQYVKTNCPEGGEVGSYAIVHGPGYDCFSGDWVNFAADHTPEDPVGYFMLINAANAPSDFYVQSVSGLCPRTSYQFGAWLMNMASHDGEIHPNLTFSIGRSDGTVIQSFQTGDIPVTNPAKWLFYDFYFTTPADVSSVVLRITNNAPGGYGNDLAIDDISFRTAGPTVNIFIDGRTGDSAMLCSNAANALKLTSTVASCYVSTSYQWQTSSDDGASWKDIPGAVNDSYTAYPTTEGSALYRLAVAQTGNLGNKSCQVASLPDSVVVLKTANPSVSIGLQPDHVCIDSAASFVATSVDGGTQPHYQWMLNGGAAGADDPVYINPTPADGDLVSCTLSSNAVCAVGPSAGSNTITVHRIPNVISSVDVTASKDVICEGDLVVFHAAPVNGGVTPSYTWLVNGQHVGKDSLAYVSAQLRDGDLVSVIMSSALACSVPVPSNTVPMTVYDMPRIQLTPDTIIAPGGYALLHPVITGAYESFSWLPTADISDGTSIAPIASPHTTTIYQLFVVNGNGCRAHAQEKVEVFYDLQMPNAFTPNGDGRNDVFRVPLAISVVIKRFSVYSRWGELLFSTLDASKGWDGTAGSHVQSIGTYIWIIEYYNPLLKRMIVKKGTVELIR